MDPIRTHETLDRRLCGEPVEVAPDRAVVALTPGPEMVADGHGLVHGGFVFGLADHAAMLAVNHPHVVLGRAEMRFLAPVRVGETLTAEARVGETEGAKIPVAVEVRRGSEVVAAGKMTCFTPERHVLLDR